MNTDETFKSWLRGNASRGTRSWKIASGLSVFICVHLWLVELMGSPAPLGIGAEDEAGEGDEHRVVAHAEAGDRGAGADAAKPPAHAEDRRARQRAHGHLRGMPAERLARDGFPHHARREVIRGERHDDGAAQDEEEPHVLPREEREDHFRLHHRREREAEAEEDAGGEDERGLPVAHRNAFTRCAVAIAVARNVNTARIDAGCSEAMPQMPWPAVQPLERRAPKPAMNPPAASRQ